MVLLYSCDNFKKGEQEMAISYNNLWKTMIDKGINKSDLCERVNISSSTVAKMAKGESVTLSVIERICKELNCEICDVVEVYFTE
jgi:DNA-binding Xre family transcriptional regulator